MVELKQMRDKMLLENCPSSQCWNYDPVRQKCYIKHIDDCYKILCEWDEMIVVISSQLYGSVYTFASNACAPQWNSEYGFWVLRHKLGECKSKTTQIEKNGER